MGFVNFRVGQSFMREAMPYCLLLNVLFYKGGAYQCVFHIIMYLVGQVKEYVLKSIVVLIISSQVPVRDELFLSPDQ